MLCNEGSSNCLLQGANNRLNVDCRKNILLLQRIIIFQLWFQDCSCFYLSSVQRLKLKTNYGYTLTVSRLFFDHNKGQYLVNDLDMVSTLTLLTDNLCECVFVCLSGWVKTKLDRVQRE